MRSWIAKCIFLIFLTPAAPAMSQPVPSREWQSVDSLSPGTHIVVTLETGARRAGRFRRSTNDDLTIDVGKGSLEVKEEVFSKARVQRVIKDDPLKDGALWGAVVGGAGALALVQAGASACGTGCENDLPAGMPLMVATFWGGIGSVVGLLVDSLDDRSEVLFPLSASRPSRRDDGSNRFFPSRPSIRIGTFYSHAVFRTDDVEGSLAAPGFVIAGQIAPYVSLHGEYSVMRGTLYPPAGSVPDNVLQNVIDPQSRVAGWSRGIESRRISFVLSELAGVHPPPLGRMRFEFLGGVSVWGVEYRDYYDAYRQLGRGMPGDPFRYEQVPGKYYVLDFESPEMSFVYGVDAEIAAARRLVIVPTFRHAPAGDPSVTAGVGVRWQF